MICVGDQIVDINGLDVTDKSLLNIYQIMKDPPRTNNSNLMQIPDIEESLSSQNSKSHDIEAKRNNNNEEVARKQHSKLKKQSTKSKLMKLMKLNDKSDRSRGYDPICVTFRRVVLCPYFSPLILYREIKKVIQNHALSSMERVVAMMDWLRMRMKTIVIERIKIRKISKNYYNKVEYQQYHQLIFG
eukprot:UN13260